MRSDLLAPARREARQRRAFLAAVAVAVVASAAIASARFELPRLLATMMHGDPPQPAAATPPAPPRPVSATAQEQDAAAAAPRPVAVQTRPLSAWLGDIARDAHRELIISPDVHGDLTATATADTLEWQSRIDSYSRVFGFEYTIADGLIEVRPKAAAGRGFGATAHVVGENGNDTGVSSATFAGARPAATVNAQRLTAADDESAASNKTATTSAAGDDKPGDKAADKPPSETRVAALSFAPAKELATVVDKAAQALGVSAAADIASNAIVLSGPRAGLDKASALVAQLDRPRRRILLEAKIIEIAHSARRDLGVEWKLTGDVGADVRLPAPVSDAGSAALLIATNGASALDARISAMEADGRLRVVSRPSVVMLEGSPATIESVRILRIRLPSRGAVVGDDVVEVSNNERATQDIPVGVRLEVTPGVRAGRKVLLRISAKSSSLGAPLPPDDIPEELSRMVEAEVMVTDGETAVLGGLLREAGSDTGAGVPFLRDVPVLGHVFNRRSKQKEAEELLVLVTPRVLE